MPLMQTLRFSIARLGQWVKGWTSAGDDAKTELPPPLLSDAQQDAYFRALATRENEGSLVDDRTWGDLEMDQVFSRLNRHSTPFGAQYLYAMLRQCRPEIPERNQKIRDLLSADPRLVRELQEALRPGVGKESAEVARLLLGPEPILPSQYRLFYLASALTLVCPLGLFLTPWFLPACLFLWVLCIVLHCVFRDRLLSHTPQLSGLASLLDCVPKLAKALDQTGLPEAGELVKVAPVCRNVKKHLARTFLKQGAGNDLALMAVEYLNVLCLFELSSVCRALVAVNQARPELLQAFKLVGRLDAWQGLTRAISEFPVICTPEASADRGFSLVDVYHPLLKAPITNSIATDGKSLLFTGTNMAGKTTFIKTLALNALLAQTLGFCLARKAVLPCVRLRTLLQREESVESGQSYFYFEATQLLRIADQTPGKPVWFVLDELFRGTNALERVAASAAVLTHLARRGLVMVTTHDHQLIRLLESQFNAYYFSEVVDADGARFDYRLKEGPCPTRNAIQLLELAGYPKEVVQLARKWVSEALAETNLRAGN